MVGHGVGPDVGHDGGGGARHGHGDEQGLGGPASPPGLVAGAGAVRGRREVHKSTGPVVTVAIAAGTSMILASYIQRLLPPAVFPSWSAIAAP